MLIQSRLEGGIPSLIAMGVESIEEVCVVDDSCPSRTDTGIGDSD